MFECSPTRCFSKGLSHGGDWRTCAVGRGFLWCGVMHVDSAGCRAQVSSLVRIYTSVVDRNVATGGPDRSAEKFRRGDGSDTIIMGSYGLFFLFLKGVWFHGLTALALTFVPFWAREHEKDLPSFFGINVSMVPWFFLELVCPWYLGAQEGLFR